MSEDASPGSAGAADEMAAIDRDVASLDQLSPGEQVPVYQRLDAALTAALDRSRESRPSGASAAES